MILHRARGLRTLELRGAARRLHNCIGKRREITESPSYSMRERIEFATMLETRQRHLRLLRGRSGSAVRRE